MDSLLESHLRIFFKTVIFKKSDIDYKMKYIKEKNYSYFTKKNVNISFYFWGVQSSPAVQSSPSLRNLKQANQDPYRLMSSVG